MREIVFFIIIEILGLLPLGLYFLVKSNLEDDDANYALLPAIFKFAVRGVVVVVICIPFFILFDKKLMVCLIGVVLQGLNLLLFKRIKRAK